jgi:hypothetical protein
MQAIFESLLLLPWRAEIAPFDSAPQFFNDTFHRVKF